MTEHTLVLSLALLALSPTNTVACTYSDYLLTITNYEDAFKNFLVSSSQTIDELNGFIIEAAYPVCERVDLFNRVFFYVSDGEVSLVGSALTFDTALDANSYFTGFLEYLSIDYHLEEQSDVLGESGVLSGTRVRLTSKSEVATVDLSMVTEHEFGEYSIYLESFSGSKHPMTEEIQ